MKKISVKSKYLVGALSTGLAPVVMASHAFADAKSEVQGGLGKASSADSGDLMTTVSTVINTMLFIAGLLAVIMIIFSGIRYISSHGDKSQVESAKNTLIYSVVGLVIAIIAYALVNWVTKLF